MTNPQISVALKEALLDTMKDVGLDLLEKSTMAIRDALNCTEVSLWTINRNYTQVDGENRPQEDRFLSTSLISRILHPKCDFHFKEKDDYSYELSEDCFFYNVLKCKDSYRRTNREGAIADGFKSKKFITEANINDVIAILITDKDSVSDVYNSEDDKRIAILELSYSQSSLDKEDWDNLAPILHDFFSAAFKRYTLIQQQNLLGELIKLQDKHKNHTVEDLFQEVIETIRTIYCPCQGASFFMWDPFNNRYNLIYTTGLEEIESGEFKKEDVYYVKGEGLTGKTGKFGKLFISDQLSKEKEDLHISKTCERVVGDVSITAKNHTKTGMFIPISYPNNSKDVVGIIRLINKTNKCEPDFVDYFNSSIDGKSMAMASRYLSLVCDFYIKQDKQTAFISKLAHEFKTPANAIFKTADRLKDNINDTSFFERYFPSYLDNIINFSLIQRWQANTTLYLAKNGKIKYNNKKCSLYDVLKKSRDVAVPIARDADLKFSNIVIMPFKSISLNIDEDAFVIVFHNLLTNAIKYHDSQNPDSFYVSLSCHETGGTIQIMVQDSGIGINIKEIDNIFEVGYRGMNAIKENATGFGVGLPVVKQIINDYGGTIQVVNCKNPTQFVITLPNSLKYN